MGKTTRKIIRVSSLDRLQNGVIALDVKTIDALVEASDKELEKLALEKADEKAVYYYIYVAGGRDKGDGTRKIPVWYWGERE